MSYLEERREARERGLEKGRQYRSYMHSSVSGLEVGVSVAAGALIGYWLDAKYGWSPWGVIGGVVVGVIHAVRVLYSLYLKSQRDEAREQAEANASDKE